MSKFDTKLRLRREDYEHATAALFAEIDHVTDAITQLMTQNSLLAQGELVWKDMYVAADVLFIQCDIEFAVGTEVHSSSEDSVIVTEEIQD